MCHTILLPVEGSFEPMRTVGQGYGTGGCIFLGVLSWRCRAMTWRAVFAFVLVVMIAASIAMAIAAVERSPGWIAHPGAATILRTAWLGLLVYAGAIVVVVANRGK